jgi:hypothetical protein
LPKTASTENTRHGQFRDALFFSMCQMRFDERRGPNINDPSPNATQDLVPTPYDCRA